MNVKITFLNGAGPLYEGFEPATAGSAGFDLCAALPEGEIFSIAPGERLGIPSGIAIEPLSSGVAGFVYSRSGLGAVQGLTVAQGVGVIDPDYRGEIKVFLLNTSGEARCVRRGDRVAQLLFQPFFRPSFIVVDELDATERGGGGFGHTGR